MADVGCPVSNSRFRSVFPTIYRLSLMMIGGSDDDNEDIWSRLLSKAPKYHTLSMDINDCGNDDNLTVGDNLVMVLTMRVIAVS